MAAKDKQAKPDKQAENRPARTAGGRFVAGKSGNPKGRPPNEFSITALLREAMTLNTVAGVTVPEGQTIAQAIRAKLLDEAINGTDFRFLKEVIERIDGKVVDLSTVEQRQIVVIRRDRHPGEPASDAGEGPA